LALDAVPRDHRTLNQTRACSRQLQAAEWTAPRR